MIIFYKCFPSYCIYWPVSASRASQALKFSLSISYNLLWCASPKISSKTSICSSSLKIVFSTDFLKAVLNDWASDSLLWSSLSACLDNIDIRKLMLPVVKVFFILCFKQYEHIIALQSFFFVTTYGQSFSHNCWKTRCVLTDKRLPMPSSDPTESSLTNNASSACSWGRQCKKSTNFAFHHCKNKNKSIKTRFQTTERLMSFRC